jgi:hypothetical protein
MLRAIIASGQTHLNFEHYYAIKFVFASDSEAIAALDKPKVTGLLRYRSQRRV